MSEYFTKLKYQDRLIIKEMLDEGKSWNKISIRLKKHRSSIGREIKRGWNQNTDEYDPDLSQLYAEKKSDREGLKKDGNKSDK